MSANLWRRIFTISATILGALAILLIFARIPRTVAIFLTAACIALGVHPVTAVLERRMRRPFAIACVYLILVVATVVLGVLVIPATVEQVQSLIANAPELMLGAQRAASAFSTTFEHRFGHGFGGAGDLQSYVAARSSAWLATIFAALPTIVVTTFSALFIGISAIVLSMFFLARGEHIAEQILSVVPLSRRLEVRTLLDEVVHIFGGFVAGQATLCAITGIAIWILLALAGCKFALLLGVLSAIGYAVPFVGMLVIQIIGAVLAIPQGPGMIWWVSIVIFVVARISDNILVPKIMAPSVGVSPIAVMFAVFAGGELFGIPGLLLGIPAAALAKVLWRLFVAPHIARRNVAPLIEEVVRSETTREIEIRETVVTEIA